MSLFFCVLFLGIASTASAGVIVYDQVTPMNKAVKLKALTKGRFLAAGGKIVKFYLEEKHIGTTLSGGDGFAFLKHRPVNPGIKHLKTKSGDDTDEGTLLVTGKNDKVVLVALESTLFDSPLSFKPETKGRDALQRISKKFRIIYASTLIGVIQSRKWLKENNFPRSAVFKWEGSDMLDDWHEKGIHLYAIIASPDVLAEASDIKKKYTFEETEDGTEVKDWDDLLKHLKGSKGN